MNTQIYEEASDWIVKNRESDLDAQDKKRFDAWLRESPHHVRAYLEMSAVWEDVPSLDPTWNPAADELIKNARAADNVVPFESESPRASGIAPQVSTSSSRFRLFALAASIAIAVFGAWLYSQRNIYSTDIGEQRSIALNDGSTIELNSRSRVRLRFTEAERGVDLMDGQALFHVAKDPARPFVVHSDSTQVRAVGTQFDVYQKKNGTIVTVVEGRVAVLSSSPLPPAGEGSVGAAQREGEAHDISLSAGEQLTVTPTAIARPKPANIAVATAWTQRRLVFESAPLTEVAEEFNRYNRRQLVILDPKLSDFHVSGVFSSSDPNLLLRFLRAQPEILLDETTREIRISRR